MRRILLFCSLLAILLVSGSSCQTLDQEVPCKNNGDCVFPFVCCSSDGLDSFAPRCTYLGECQSFSPFLVAGNPCRRRPPSTEISEPYYGECSSGTVCCASTLTCAASDPDTGADPCPKPTVAVDGGDLPCTADHECPSGSICCGIDVYRRGGACKSVEGCGGISLPPGSGGSGGGAGTGGAGGGAGAGVCPEPLPPAADPACDAIVPRPQEGLIGYWPIENEPGTVACDYSGQGRHGERDTGAEFNGAGREQGGWSMTVSNNGGLRIHTGAELDFEPVGSVSFWLNLESTGPGGFLASRGDFNSDSLSFGVNPCLDLQMYTRQADDGSSTDSRAMCGLLALNTWMHLAAVVDAAGEQRFYRGGQLVYTSTQPVASRMFCGDLLFGKHATSQTELRGRFDDLKWWNIALTPAQICQEAGGSFVGGNCSTP